MRETATGSNAERRERLSTQRHPRCPPDAGSTVGDEHGQRAGGRGTVYLDKPERGIPAGYSGVATQRIAAAARAARGRTGAAATECAQSPSDPRRNGAELWQKPAALSGNRERPLGGSDRVSMHRYASPGSRLR
jgi:hypothetical protein